ncbi:DNA polymerase II large subunit [Halobacterium sp. NMX12-1]|uniref:DNA polymerase II large subunit n=1 Tax=Halobacterium sp. NMX12-1 TaxID=3166650 RepID=A0AAU8CGE9_9EURY
MRPEDEAYFESLEAGLDEAFDVAERAKQRGEDPKPEVEIPVAKDMADRVENILGIDGVAERVRDLEGEMSREEAALELVEDFVEGRVGDYETKAGKVEGAVRTAVALLTEGVVAAPIEGIDRVEVNANDDGTEYVAVYYAGPIRSAGGTAQALSVLVADYARALLDIDRFKPRDDEIERYAEEVDLYDSETGLQYSPKDKETKFITEHCPVMLDGEATGDEEVDGFRDLERIATNSARGGMCLVLAEGIALKAPKIQRYTRNLDEVEWPWLQDLIDGTIGKDDDSEGDDDASDDAADEAEVSTDADDASDEPEGPPRVDPSNKFLRDLIAGRPVFGHPSNEGGFRLRYGRSRNHGFATAGIHPATMHLVDDFLATGTQIKTERPGKAAGIVPVDSIEGPTVKLANGDVRRIDDPEEALEVRNGVVEILDVGEYLVNYGEFVENNHELAPASYAPEWWIQDFEAAGADVQALRDSPYVDLEAPDVEQALEWATEYDAPLHPKYTYLWHDVEVADFEALANAVAAAHTEDGNLVLNNEDAVREPLEALLVEHRQDDDEIRIPDWLPLVRSLGVTEDLSREWDDLSADAREWPNALAAVNEVAPFEVRERAPTRIGNRMGRPEKSESRDLSPAVHTLFPIGEAGGSQRDVSEAARYAPDMKDTPGKLDVQLGVRECPSCGDHTFEPRCGDCGEWTDPHYECPDCNVSAEPDESGRVECPRCERELDNVEVQTVDVGSEYRDALQAVGERENAFDQLKGVKGLSSAEKVPEPMEKGVLRAKHDVSTFKDGTVRYDMTDLPVTSVKPSELDVTVEHFRELGYEEDIHGDPLEHDDQLVELRVQDVVLSDGAAEHMLQTADFVDDLLTQYYGLDPFYELEERDDLVGELVFGMAPHTSAAVVGRVIGFTSASVGYAHPYFHAAKRRNCFHPETKVWFEDEAGEAHHDTIETLVEDRLDPETADEDDFGTLVQELDGDVHVPSLTEDGDQVRKPVEAVSKHPAPDHMIHVETGSGRELTVTPDHEVHVFRDGSITTKTAAQLTDTDHVLTPTDVDTLEPTQGRRVFDLLAEFARVDAIENDQLTVKGIGRAELYDLFTDALAADWDGQFYPLKSTAEYLGVTKKALSNYVYRESLPFSLLTDVFGSVEETLDVIPDDVTLGMKRDTAEVDRYVELNERVGTLLGYYAAEGFTRKQTTSKGTIHQTTISGIEDEAREFFVETLREEFGANPYRENDKKVTVSGRLLRTFFDTVLDAGVHADSKRVPQCVFDSSAAVVGAYLSGYFSGDGHVTKQGLTVSATTVSRELKDDVVALLTRLGISSTVHKPEQVPLVEKFPDYYDADDESMSARSFVVRVSSEDAVTFHERVGFHLTRKETRLASHVENIKPAGSRIFDGGDGDYLVDKVVSVDYEQSTTDYTYCLTVSDTHSLIPNDIYALNCDGDEDCVMLLMDGLINFSKSYLPDQRGGSVAEDSRLVAVDPDGDVRFLTFDEFWDELEAPIETDGKFRKRTCYSEGWQTYAFDDNHEASLEPIEKAIRYQADDDDQLVRVETQFGRSLEITEHHSLFRYDDGIEEVAGADLEAGDLVVAPRDLDVDTRETTLDVTDCVDDPYVVIDDDVEELLRTAWESTDRGSETHGAFNAGLAYRLNKSKIGFERFQQILAHSELDVPTDIEVGLEGSSLGITRTIEVDEDFAWLLGLFVAEGTTSSVNPCIHNADEDLIDRAADIATDKLGTEPGRRWSNRAYELRFPAVFREVLYSLGFENADSYDSSEKVVPECILHAPRSVVLDFLRGFIAGDGSDSSNDNVTTVSFHTTSDDVKDGIMFLLHRLGLVTNVSTKTNRDGNRQDIHTVTVSGGANDNPLHRLLDGDDPYLPKSLVVSIPSTLMELREMDIAGVKQTIPKYLKRRDNISLEKLTEIVDTLDEQELPSQAEAVLEELRPLVDGDLSYLRVKDIESVDYDGYLYDLQVGGDPVFTANWLYAHNSMDAPLVMSSRIDPSEIDDEAHNMDVVSQYPRAFYEATREMADPGEVEDLVEIAEDSLGTDTEYAGFEHTHDTSNIHLGPSLSAYKTLGSMMDKMDAQLELARKLRAVDETDVAERVIEYHFLPDLIGNLRAFSRQETRCLDCGEKYRRMPLTGDCRECGGRVNLTVHEGSVNKYMDTAITVAEEYDCREYTKQRLEVLQNSLESIFENDKNKQSGIADFM